MNNVANDIKTFNESVTILAHNFRKHPLDYPSEEPIRTHLYSVLSEIVKPLYKKVSFRPDCDEHANKPYVKKFMDELKGLTHSLHSSRIQIEISFRPKIDEKDISYDLAILSDSRNSLYAVSKAMGPVAWDRDKQEISVLCEIKHSRNEGARRWKDVKTVPQDILRISEFMSVSNKVSMGVILFFDFWGDDDTFAKRREEITNEVPKIKENYDEDVYLYYIPRLGKIIGKLKVNLSAKRVDVINETNE